MITPPGGARKAAAPPADLLALMREVLSRLDIEAEYRAHFPGLRVASGRPTHRGWLDCHALTRLVSA